MGHAISPRHRPHVAAIAMLVMLALQIAAPSVRAAAAIAVDVTKVGSQYAYRGDEVEFRFDVSNPGDLRVNALDVSGSLCDSVPTFVSGDTSADGWLDPGEVFRYGCAYVVTGYDQQLLNTANVSATPDGGGSVTATAQVGFTVLFTGVQVEPYFEPDPLFVGHSIVYGFVVLNAGTTPLTAASVTSAECLSPMTGPDRDEGDDGELAPDAMEAWFFSCDGPTVGASDTAFHVAGHVEATDLGGKVVEHDASADINVSHPSMTFTSATTVTSASPGDTITFGYDATNTGDTHIGTITVDHTACDAGTFKYGDDGIISGIEPGKTWHGTCTHKVTEAIGTVVKNVFHFTAYGGIEYDFTAQASVAIVVRPANPTATPRPAPTAAPSTTAVAPSASALPSEVPSAAPASPAPSAAATAPAETTPEPTIAPAPASSADTGLPVLPIVLLLVVIAVAGGGWFAWQRRRVTPGGEVDL